MDLVVFVVFACKILRKHALQATLRVFGLCGSRVVLVWADLWFLVTCGFWLWSARPIHLMWFLRLGGLVSMPMLARGLARPLTRIDARPLALCGLLKRFAHCPASCYVPFRRHWR